MECFGFREYMETTKGKTIVDFAQKVKEMPDYDFYERVVKSRKKENTASILGMTVLLRAMSDERFKALMYSIATDLLFKKVDKMLRAEILGESEGENED